MRWAALGLAALLLGGCTSHGGPKPPADTAHWQMGFRVTPSPPRQLDPTRFQALLTDSRNKPVHGAAVTAALVMPAMDMGDDKVALHETAAGTYTGTGRFTMPGNWEAMVSADKGAAHQSQIFLVCVR